MKRQNKRYYYLYKITNTTNNMIYIGIHASNKLRDTYLGSGVEIKKAIKKFGKNVFIKEYLEYFDNEHDMLKREREVVNSSFIKRKDTYNLVLGAGNYTMINRIVVKDIEGNKFSIDKNDVRYLSGELVGHCKGNVVAKDSNGNYFRISKNDPRYLSGELVHNSKYTVTAKDKNGNTSRVSIFDPRYLSGELVHNSKGNITVRDKDGNTFQVDKNDPRFLNKELVGLNKGKFNVKDRSGKIYQISKDDPRYLSGELIHIRKSFK